MKINTIQINNFRSLKQVSIDHVSNLITIIGPNSVGKSNLLEALDFFFANFDPSPQRSLGSLQDYIWFDRDSNSPIEISLKFDLTKDEAQKIIPKNFHKSLTENNILTVSRKIYGPYQNAIIKTVLVRLNEESIYSDEKSPMVTPTQQPPPQPAPQPDAQTSELLRNLHLQFQHTFKVIPAARNFVNPIPAGHRNSTIQPNILTELTQIGGSLENVQQRRWEDIESTITDSSKEISDVRVTASQVTVKEKESKSRFPIFLIGGGNQELFTLAHQLSTGFAVYGVEEPETHLHPHLARRLFKTFKEISQNNQLIITTHSTVFVDQSELGNTWIVSKRGKEAKIERLENAETLQKLLIELGVRPSDIFYSNALLFVEGHVDKTVYPILAKKLDIEFDNYGLSIIPIRGSGSGKYHLSVWIEAIKNTKLPFFMILDKDAQKEAEQLLKDKILKKGENLFLLEEGSIEHYYPQDTIYQAIKNVYGFDTSAEEKSAIEKNFISQMPAILKNHSKDPEGWKSLIGEEVANIMKPQEIDNDLRRILERIDTNLSLSMK